MMLSDGADAFWGIHQCGSFRTGCVHDSFAVLPYLVTGHVGAQIHPDVLHSVQLRG